jgi:murein L,D-transpeptidase YafK
MSALGRTNACILLAALLAASPASEVLADEPKTTALATRLVVHKRAHTMDVYNGDELLREIKVSLGRGGLRPKTRQGDLRVPEGNYVIDGSNPNSAFHLSLHISYPSPEQVAAAKVRGTKPGGGIMIHGLPNDLPRRLRKVSLGDWTDGCIAVTDSEIEWLWETVPDGTPILIVP